MNVDNGHLVRDIDDIPEDEKDFYKEVPADLSLNAELELMGQDETTVGIESSGRMADWARVERLKEKLKKRKMAKVYCKR